MNREYVCLSIPELTEHGWEEFGQLVPREEVVRCRECVFSEGDGDLCVFFGDGWNKHTANVDPDGFCAWGIRRDE